VQRLAGWGATLEILEKAPLREQLIGHGCGRSVFVWAVKEYEPILLSHSEKELKHAHNSLFQTLVEKGILGTLGLAAAWTAAFFVVCRGSLRA
jgi:O-antigen ligase